jgi:hypothetical protein
MEQNEVTNQKAVALLLVVALLVGTVTMLPAAAKKPTPTS